MLRSRRALPCCFRPMQVGVETVSSLDDVQRFHLLLEPDGAESKCRLLQISKKHLPSPTKHEVCLAVVMS